jgi:hypothetical protein
MRVAIVSLTALALAGCMTPSHDDRHARTRPTVWGGNAAANAEARNVQVIVARNAKEARCKGEVSERPGRDGTAPRDYKCKRFQG